MGQAYLKELYSSFTSRRVTISLIAVLSGLYFLGLIIPQRSLLSPEQYAAWRAEWPTLVDVLTTLNLTSLYSSPLVIALTTLFFLNLVLVTAKRVPAVLKSVRIPASIHVSDEIVQTMPVHAVVALEGPERVTALRTRLRSQGFHVVDGRNGLLAIKNRFSPVGSLLFHVSFLFFLVGGLVLFHSRFRGETFVTEGQVFNGTRADYRSVFRLSEMRTSLPELRFIVEWIRPQFEKLEPVSLEAWITAESGGQHRAGRIDVNHPFRLGATSVLITDVGIAPYVQILDQGGREMLGAFVALNIIRGEEDHFPVPGTDYSVWVRFWPDAAIDEAGKRYSRSYDLNNPLYAVTVRKKDTAIATGTLITPAASLAFDGHRLFIRDMRYYGGFMIVNERGGSLLIVGFILALLGLLIKFLWPKKQFLAYWNGAPGPIILHLGYQAEYQKGLGQETFDRIIAEVR